MLRFVFVIVALSLPYVALACGMPSEDPAMALADVLDDIDAVDSPKEQPAASEADVDVDEDAEVDPELTEVTPPVRSSDAGSAQARSDAEEAYGDAALATALSELTGIVWVRPETVAASPEPFALARGAVLDVALRDLVTSLGQVPSDSDVRVIAASGPFEQAVEASTR